MNSVGPSILYWAIHGQHFKSRFIFTEIIVLAHYLFKYLTCFDIRIVLPNLFFLGFVYIFLLMRNDCKRKKCSNLKKEMNIDYTVKRMLSREKV